MDIDIGIAVGSGGVTKATTFLVLCQAVACALSIASCASSRASMNEATLRGANYALNLGQSPPNWKRIDPNGALVALSDGGSGVAFVNVRCGSRNEDIPLVALTNHLIIGTTEREFITQESIPFDRREALHTVMNAKLDGVPRSYDIYVLKKDGCIFDFVYATLPNEFASGAPQFERFVTSAHTVDAGDRP